MLRFARHDRLQRARGIAGVLVLLALVDFVSAEVLVLTRDRALRGDGVQLTEAGQVEVVRAGDADGGTGTDRVKLEDCLLMRFDPLARRSRARTWVMLSDGRRLSGDELVLGPETLTLQIEPERTVSFVLDEVIGLFLHADRPEVTAWPEADTRVIRANGDVMDVPFAELTEAGVIVDIDPSVDPILLPLDQVRAVLWPREDSSDAEGSSENDVMLVLRTGERLSGRLAALTDDRVELVVDDERFSWPVGELEAIRLGNVEQVGVQGDQVSSQATPETNGRPHLRMHRNGLGSPMRVGQRMYAEGIGLRGQMTVEIEVPERALWFTGGMGVDADAGSFARLAFTVEVDGQIVEDITGLVPGAPARRVVLNVAGKRTIVIKVLAEHGSDVGCLGDVVDASFIVD